MTWDCDDCRTYTTALRWRTVGGKRSTLVIGVLLVVNADRLNQYPCKHNTDLARSAALIPSSLPGSNARLICLPKSGLGALYCFIDSLPYDAIVAGEVCRSTPTLTSPANSDNARRWTRDDPRAIPAQTTGSNIEAAIRITVSDGVRTFRTHLSRGTEPVEH